MTKEKIVKAVRLGARKLRRNPSMHELRLMAGIPAKAVHRRVGSLRKALESAGLAAIGPGFSPGESTLLLDWARVARKLKKLPSVLEHERAGRFSFKPFHRHYGSWTRVPGAFRKFVHNAHNARNAQNKGLKRQWRDVLKMIAARLPWARLRRPGLLPAMRPRASLQKKQSQQRQVRGCGKGSFSGTGRCMGVRCNCRSWPTSR